VARLLKESGADVRYVGTACPKTRFSDADREWLAAYDIPVTYRASLEQDLAAIEAFEPDLAIGTTPVVQKAKEKGIPSLYFTNLISARPLMGPAGAGSLADVVNSAMGRAGKMDEMKAFFEGVGEGWAAGVWEKAPTKPKEKRKGKTLIAGKSGEKPADVVKGSIVEDV
jgi:chlorophyllide a reductase subunit Y